MLPAYFLGEAKTRQRWGGPLPKAWAKSASCRVAGSGVGLNAGVFMGGGCAPLWLPQRRRRGGHGMQGLALSRAGRVHRGLERQAPGAYHPNVAGLLTVCRCLELCNEDGRLLLNLGDPVGLPCDVPRLKAAAQQASSREGGCRAPARTHDPGLANTACALDLTSDRNSRDAQQAFPSDVQSKVVMHFRQISFGKL
jgi:hypothetical protein